MFGIWFYTPIKKQNTQITRNALTGEETLAVTEKHQHLDKNKVFNLKNAFLNKNFYSTKSKNSSYSQKEDKDLSYITPLNNLNL
jgi:hypothetical protein